VKKLQMHIPEVVQIQAKHMKESKKGVEEETKGTNLLLFRGTWSRNYILQPLHFSNPVPGKTGIHNKVPV
jgi:hypothetical protein